MSFVTTPRLTTGGAKMMLDTAIQKADEFGISITVAIVDAGGHLLVLERMDGGRFHTVHSPTTQKGAQGQDLDTLHAIGLALAARSDRWTAMEGGFPILVEGECVGGIGVSGGDWQQDQDIALAAIKSIGADI